MNTLPKFEWFGQKGSWTIDANGVVWDDTGCPLVNVLWMHAEDDNEWFRKSNPEFHERLMALGQAIAHLPDLLDAVQELDRLVIAWSHFSSSHGQIDAAERLRDTREYKRLRDIYLASVQREEVPDGQS